MGPDLASYVSASEIPIKLIRQSGEAVKDGVIRPYHLHLKPTNRCNLNCSWCSCRNVDRKLELSTRECRAILSHFKALGSRACTISGGGEPTMHDGLCEIVGYAKRLGHDVSLVTNGIRIAEAESKYDGLNDKLTWCRVSVTPSKDYVELIPRIAAKWPDVRIGITMTIDNDTDAVTAPHICDTCEPLDNVTHIRFVTNILNPDSALLARCQRFCNGRTTKAIYQDRTPYTKGANPCHVSLLKPVVDPSGYVFPCCGVQYATDELRQTPECMRLCHWTDFGLGIRPFDGSICQKCYYSEYNRTLAALTKQIDHVNFV